jgi:flagellar protein FlaG
MSTEINLTSILPKESQFSAANKNLDKTELVNSSELVENADDTKEDGSIADMYSRQSAVDADNINKAVSNLQSLFDGSNFEKSLQARSLEFSVSSENDRTVVKVIDKESQDVIRQIPSEEFIRVAEKLSELSDEMKRTRGVLFDEKV